MKRLTRLLLFILSVLINEAEAGTVFVNLNAVGLDNGSSWINAYSSLETALWNSDDGDSLWIAKGTYFPTSSFLVFSGVRLYGGFSGTESSFSQRNVLMNPVILSGDLDQSNNFSSGDAQRILVIYPPIVGTVLDGLIIQNNYGKNVGALYLNVSIAGTNDLTINNCCFRDNRIDADSTIDALGSACFIRTSVSGANLNLKISNCEFRNNSANCLGTGVGEAGACEIANINGLGTLTAETFYCVSV